MTPTPPTPGGEPPERRYPRPGEGGGSPGPGGRLFPDGPRRGPGGDGRGPGGRERPDGPLDDRRPMAPVEPPPQPKLAVLNKMPEFGKGFALPEMKIQFLPVPSGTFRMGSPGIEPGRENDETHHEVSLSRPFWLARTELTQSDFKRFVSARQYVTSAEKQGYAFAWTSGQAKQVTKLSWKTAFTGDDMPVTCVSLADTAAFCSWLNERELKAGRLPAGYQYRIPTEAEWEYCCRAGERGPFGHGPNPLYLPQYAWFDKNSATQPQLVATRLPNNWGFHDLHGNVWEWCYDRSDMEGVLLRGDTYREGISDPMSFAGDRQVVRGGAFNQSVEHLRSANRHALVPGFACNSLGIRLALGPVRKP